jgi:hypothetical protein
MHINAIRPHNEQEDKTVVFAFAGWQSKLHVTQKMDRAVGPDSHSVFWQDQNHGLRNRIFIQPVKDTVHSADGLL